jgi:hypothetical protein
LFTVPLSDLLDKNKWTIRDFSTPVFTGFYISIYMYILVYLYEYIQVFIYIQINIYLYIYRWTIRYMGSNCVSSSPIPSGCSK